MPDDDCQRVRIVHTTHPETYPGTDIKISGPFFSVCCNACGKKYWSIRFAEHCELCGSAELCCMPADCCCIKTDKVSLKNA